MKKLLISACAVLVCAVIGLAVLHSFRTEAEPEEVVREATQSTNANPLPDESAILETAPPTTLSWVEQNSVIPEVLPVYQPGSIKLEYIDPEQFGFVPTKRRVYYLIDGYVIELAPEGTIAKLFEKNKDIFHEPQEMALVTFVKYCKISKTDFEATIEKTKELYNKMGFDMTHEDYELPNADIIYTFDNDIINEYYRR